MRDTPRIVFFVASILAAADALAGEIPSSGSNDLESAQRWLAAHGVTYQLTYTNDVLANVRGGNRRGAIDQGKLEPVIAIDFEKLAGFSGLSFYANAFQIHNTGRIRRDYVGGLNTIAAIEAVPATRLSELWFEQKLFNSNTSIRFGQLAADVEFFFATASELFLQSDWPTITATNLPSGGPAYPLSTPGVRLKYDLTDQLSLLAAVFNGDPAGPGDGDEQLRNRHGLNFRIRDPALVMAEAQLRTNQRKEDTGLARTLKLGGWTHFGTFEHKRLGPGGTLISDPAGPGIAAKHRGNFGIYGVIEQQLYRPEGGDATKGITAFGRISSSPSDRNFIDFYVDGGLVFAGLVPNRPDDKFGASIIYARFSDSIRGFDRDRIAFGGMTEAARDFETNLELTYLAQITPSWTVQPVLTYIWHPSGVRGRDAMVTGVRSVWRFGQAEGR